MDNEQSGPVNGLETLEKEVGTLGSSVYVACNGCLERAQEIGKLSTAKV